MICFKGVGRTYSTDSDGKWIILTTKASKDAAILFIENLIENSNAPNTNPNKKPCLSTIYNFTSTLVSYAAIFQQKTEPIHITKKTSSLGEQTQNFQISYNLISSTDFPTSEKSKQSPPDTSNESSTDLFS